MAGASLPLPLHNYMVLFTLAKGTTKSKVLTKLITDWIDRQKEKNPEDKLINTIIVRINTKRKEQKESKSFDKFKKDLHQELIDKGLTEEQVIKILNEIEDK
jgi:hypothetical protein